MAQQVASRNSLHNEQPPHGVSHCVSQPADSMAQAPNHTQPQAVHSWKGLAPGPVPCVNGAWLPC